MNASNPPGELKAPRVYTFVDVAMKLAHDGPWYFVLAVVLVLSLRGTSTATESLIGLALAMLARNRPPDAPTDKAALLRGMAGAGVVLLVIAAVHYALSSSAPLSPALSQVSAGHADIVANVQPKEIGP